MAAAKAYVTAIERFGPKAVLCSNLAVAFAKLEACVLLPPNRIRALTQDTDGRASSMLRHWR
jgi:hypothetical protein